MCGFIAQLVEQRTDEALIFFFQASSFHAAGKFTAMIILHFYSF